MKTVIQHAAGQKALDVCAAILPFLTKGRRTLSGSALLDMTSHESDPDDDTTAAQFVQAALKSAEPPKPGERDYLNEHGHPLVCVFCGLPMFHENESGEYVHAVVRAESCFNESDRDEEDPNHPILAGRHLVLHLSQADTDVVKRKVGTDHALLAHARDASRALDAYVLLAQPDGRMLFSVHWRSDAEMSGEDAPAGEPAVLRVTTQGEEPWECTVEEFLAANPEETDVVRALAAGESMSTGGGAQPRSTILRVS